MRDGTLDLQQLAHRRRLRAQRDIGWTVISVIVMVVIGASAIADYLGALP